MAFPDQSNFNSAGPDDAWYQIVHGEQVTLCVTNGRAFIRALQRHLRDSVPANSLTYDRSRITPRTSMAIDGRWGALTSKALWVATSRSGAPTALSAGLANDARARVIGQVSLQAAVWIMARIGIESSLHFEDLRMRNPTVPPVWGVEPPMPPAGSETDIRCAVQPPAAPPPPPPVPPPPPAPPLPEPPPTVEEVQTGTATPTAVGDVTVPVPTGVNGQDTVVGSGVPWGAVAVVTIGVAAVAGIGVMLAKDEKKRVSTPSAPSRSASKPSPAPSRSASKRRNPSKRRRK